MYAILLYVYNTTSSFSPSIMSHPAIPPSRHPASPPSRWKLTNLLLIIHYSHSNRLYFLCLFFLRVLLELRDQLENLESLDQEYDT